MLHRCVRRHRCRCAGEVCCMLQHFDGLANAALKIFKHAAHLFCGRRETFYSRGSDPCNFCINLVADTSSRKAEADMSPSFACTTVFPSCLRCPVLQCVQLYIIYDALSQESAGFVFTRFPSFTINSDNSGESCPPACCQIE